MSAPGVMSALARGPSEVLAALREVPSSNSASALSGESLSERLGVSRAQIWKHVGALRTRGYEIEGEPGGGYRLVGSPDRLYAWELAPGLDTKWLAQQVQHFDETESTNLIAFDLGRENAPGGTTVIAESQTAGRGRLGRSFYSPPYKNLYTSILLRPEGSISDAPTLILAAAGAVAETVAEFMGDESAVEIKWPNDVMIRRRKTCGILMESSAEGTRIAFAVLGIGVNLNVDRETFPDEFRHLATSLSSELGHPVDRIAFARQLFTHLEHQVDLHESQGFEAIRPRFESFFRMRGESIGIEDIAGERIECRARAIAPNGALEVEIQGGPRSGEIMTVMAGDVTLAKRTRSE